MRAGGERVGHTGRHPHARPLEGRTSRELPQDNTREQLEDLPRPQADSTEGGQVRRQNLKEIPQVKKNKSLPAETIASYRLAATRPSVAEQVDDLNALSWHHELLDLLLDRKTLAVGAEKMWLARAIRLGATPAATPAEAHLKITYLQACIDGWVGTNATRSHHELHAVLIMGAIGAEEHRWAFPTETKPN